MKALIQAHQLSFSIEETCVLDNINFSIDPGQIVTLIGPNGAGKTTLLKIILGLIHPTSGEIKKRPTLKIGYMPQKLDLNPLMRLTVQDFLKLTEPKASTDMLFAVLQKMGAESILKTQITHISGGEMQRVLLARAFLTQPDLLVLDEPAQGVDVIGQAEFYRQIQQYRAQNRCAVLLVSHDLHLVMQASDLVICLNHHICCSGSPEAVRADAHYEALFGGEALALYRHHHDHRHDGPHD